MSPENEYIARKRADFIKQVHGGTGRQLYDGAGWRDWKRDEIIDTPFAVIGYIGYLEQRLREAKELLALGNQLLAERVKDGCDDFARGGIYASEEHFEHG